MPRRRRLAAMSTPSSLPPTTFQWQQLNYRAAAPPRRPQSGCPSSAGASSCQRPRSQRASSPCPRLLHASSTHAQLSLLSSTVFACGMVTAGGTAKNAPPLPVGGNGDAVLPATDNGPTTVAKLLRRRSPIRSTIGSSLLRQRLLLSTSMIPSLPRPRSSRAWVDDGN